MKRFVPGELIKFGNEHTDPTIYKIVAYTGVVNKYDAHQFTAEIVDEPRLKRKKRKLNFSSPWFDEAPESPPTTVAQTPSDLPYQLPDGRLTTERIEELRTQIDNNMNTMATNRTTVPESTLTVTDVSTTSGVVTVTANPITPTPAGRLAAVTEMFEGGVLNSAQAIQALQDLVLFGSGAVEISTDDVAIPTTRTHYQALDGSYQVRDVPIEAHYQTFWDNGDFVRARSQRVFTKKSVIEGDVSEIKNW